MGKSVEIREQNEDQNKNKDKYRKCGKLLKIKENEKMAK